MVSRLSQRGGFMVMCAACTHLGASLLLVLAQGCCQRPHESGTAINGLSEALPHSLASTSATNQIEAPMKTLLSIWRSPNSTPKQRADALNKWLPPETTIESARSLLGGDCFLSRHYGPLTILISGTNGIAAQHGGHYEAFFLEYKTPGGSVNLGFGNQRGASREWRFEGAYAPGQIITKTNWGYDGGQLIPAK